LPAGIGTAIHANVLECHDLIQRNLCKKGRFNPNHGIPPRRRL
jgi:hypothetical protein